MYLSTSILARHLTLRTTVREVPPLSPLDVATHPRPQLRDVCCRSRYIQVARRGSWREKDPPRVVQYN